MMIKNKHLMPSERYVMIRTIGDNLAIIKSMGQHEMLVTTDIMQEILEMLKEQEPVKPVCFEHRRTRNKYQCGNCGSSEVFKEWEYCPWCGRKMKWDS